MKAIFTLLLLLLSASLIAQPEGKLFMLQQGALPSLSYIQYPGDTYQQVDIVEGNDLAANEDNLLVARGFGADGVYVYDLATLTRNDTITGTYANWIDMWEDEKLVVASSQAPYLRVFDLANNNQLLFSLLDTSVLTYAPGHLLVSDDRAYVLLQDRVVVVDLDLEDTLAVVLTPHPFHFGGQNAYLTDGGDKFYLNVEYATGAIRSSLMSIDKLTLAVDTAFHFEGWFNQYPPVGTPDKIYVFEFESHFDIIGDSLYLFTRPSQFVDYAINYDPKSEAIFTYGGTLTPNTVRYYHNGMFSTPVSAPTMTNSLFVEGTSTAIDDGELIAKTLQLFPNPTVDRINLTFESPQMIHEVRIVDTKGRLLLHRSYEQWMSWMKFDVSTLAHGGYFLEVNTAEGKVSSPFVKW